VIGLRLAVAVGELDGAALGVDDATGVELAPLLGDADGVGLEPALLPEVVEPSVGAVDAEGDWLGVASGLAVAPGVEVGVAVGVELGEVLGAGDAVDCCAKAAAVGTRVTSIGCQLPDASR
jgi:hypothetical protein